MIIDITDTNMVLDVKSDGSVVLKEKDHFFPWFVLNQDELLPVANALTRAHIVCVPKTGDTK